MASAKERPIAIVSPTLTPAERVGEALDASTAVRLATHPLRGQPPRLDPARLRDAVGRLLARGLPSLSLAEQAAYDAPVPDPRFKVAFAAFANMVPDGPQADGADIGRQARQFFQQEWSGQSFLAIGQRDPVLGEPVMRRLAATIRGCPEPLLIGEAGHFVQEWGAPLARRALEQFRLV